MNLKLFFVLVTIVFSSKSILSQSCSNPVAAYSPVATEYMISDIIIEQGAQVFIATYSTSHFQVSLELATCKVNGLCDAQLDVVTVTGGEPDWNNSIGSAIVLEPNIYDIPGCVPGTFGTATFSYSGVNLVAGTQYALVLKPAPGGNPAAGLLWRRSSIPTDPANPYSGGALWTYDFLMMDGSFSANLDLQFEVCPSCYTSISEYNPIATEYMVSSSGMEYAAQVFTPSISASNFQVSLELATCKGNGLCNAQLDVVTVTGGEPDWNNSLGSAIVLEPNIYGIPGCVPGTFGTATFSYSGVNLAAGTQYALVLKPAPGGSPSAGLLWRRSSIPTDPSNPYSGGALWTYDFLMMDGSSIPNLDLQFEIFNAQVPSGTNSVTGCDSHTWIDGNTYTVSNNTATHTIIGGASNGCDSIVTLNLTINNSTFSTDVITACDEYTWIDGITYSSSNNSATHTLTNAAGCDSIVTLNLTIRNSSFSTDVVVACNSYTWIDGVTYTSGNSSATHTLINAGGCDSVVTLNLTINTADSTVTQNGVTLMANASGATYKWLDCDNGNAVVPGEINQSYSVTVNGNYAVEVTENGCTDTSACYLINTVGVVENSFGSDIILYPNPTNGLLVIDFGKHNANFNVSLKNTLGQEVDCFNGISSNIIELTIKGERGVYFIEISGQTGEKSTFKVLKQ